MWQKLLPSAPDNANRDGSLSQSASGITNHDGSLSQSASGITNRDGQKCDYYYTVW